LLQKSGKVIERTIESDQHGRSPIDKDVAPVYVETTEGFVKTYETVRVETTDNGSSASNQGSEDILGEPSPKQAHGSRRLTEQTERLYDDTRPTSTTGPSFLTPD
jgi:hypothetical protein